MNLKRLLSKLKTVSCQGVQNKTIYPNMYNIFEALKITSYKDTKFNFRTRSLSWRKSSSWPGFFSTKGSSDATILNKYI